MPALRLGRLSVLLLAAAPLLACGGEEVERLPLFDGRLAPDVLVEQRRLAPPPDAAGNRFLSGWWPWRDGETEVLTAGPEGGRLEVVHLAPRRRTLSLDLLPSPTPTAERVRARAAGRELGTFPWTDPLEIPLPADLQPGRVLLELIPEGGDEPTLHALAAAVRPALPAGEARIEGKDLLQGGDSLVTLAFPVAAGQELVGTLVPPRRPGAGRRLELSVEDAAGRPLAGLRWDPGWRSRLAGRRSFRLPLSETGGWVRLRLLSRGEGGPATWQGLGLTPPPGPLPPRAGAPPGDRGGKPLRLVVLYVMDALRADHLGPEGAVEGASPTLDRLAAEGVTFLAHRSLAPNTLPSTKALFTGGVWVDRGGWKLPPEGPPTLAEAFRAAGYRTGLFSGNTWISAAYGMDRGFDHGEPEVLFDEAAGGDVNDNAEQVHRAALAWLRTLAPGERAFLYLHTLHPHNPYAPPRELRERFAGGTGSAIDGRTATLLDIQRRRLEAGPADRRRLRGLYAGGLAYNDAELASFLAALAEVAPPEETWLAVTSDHGEELFDHGGVLHGYTLYEEMIRIPLVLWAPGRLDPDEVERPTSTLDLHALLLALAGGGPGPEPVAGGPLPERVEPPVHLAAAASVEGGLYSAQSEHWKVVLAPRTGRAWGLGEGLGRSRDPEYLFDLRRDPGETRNLAGEGDLEVDWLRSRLLAWVARHRGEEAGQPAPEVDAATRERLRALGYLQ